MKLTVINQQTSTKAMNGVGKSADILHHCGSAYKTKVEVMIQLFYSKMKEYRL